MLTLIVAELCVIDAFGQANDKDARLELGLETRRFSGRETRTGACMLTAQETGDASNRLKGRFLMTPSEL